VWNSEHDLNQRVTYGADGNRNRWFKLLFLLNNSKKAAKAAAFAGIAAVLAFERDLFRRSLPARGSSPKADLFGIML